MTAGATPAAIGGGEWRLRAVLRELWHLPERLLHPTRRSRARARIGGIGVPRHVLVLCHGNVCRSPYAQLELDRALRQQALAGVNVTSAGFIGPGRPSPAGALVAAARRGLDLAGHRSALVTRDSIAASDLVIVMSAEQGHAARTLLGARAERVLVLGDLDPEPISRRTIPDPWKGGDAEFDSSYARIDRCIDALAELVASAAPHSPHA